MGLTALLLNQYPPVVWHHRMPPRRTFGIYQPPPTCCSKLPGVTLLASAAWPFSPAAGSVCLADSNSACCACLARLNSCSVDRLTIASDRMLAVISCLSTSKPHALPINSRQRTDVPGCLSLDACDSSHNSRTNRALSHACCCCSGCCIRSISCAIWGSLDSLPAWL